MDKQKIEGLPSKEEIDNAINVANSELFTLKNYLQVGEMNIHRERFEKMVKTLKTFHKIASYYLNNTDCEKTCHELSVAKTMIENLQAQGERGKLNPEEVKQCLLKADLLYHKQAAVEDEFYDWLASMAEAVCSKFKMGGMDEKFINHIKAHLKEGEEVICKICGKTAKAITDQQGEK